MRKILALAVAGAVAFGVVTMANAGEETQQEVFKVKPTKIKKKNHQNVKLINEVITPDDPDLGQPPSATRTIVDWPKQFKFGLKKVPYCKTDEDGLNAAPTVEDAKAACGKKSQVSSDKGSEAVIRTTLAPPFDVVNVDVVAFNEKGKRLYLYSKPTGDASAVPASVLTGKLKKFGAIKDVDRPDGPFKQSLDVNVPPLAAGAIAYFKVTIPKSKYVQAKCKPKKMTAQATTLFSNGDTPQSTDDHTIKCKPKK